MPRHVFTYDPALKETPEWQSLYNKWAWLRKHRRGDAFAQFQDFYDWSMANGFVIGARLKLLDESKPYSPDNCLWMHPVLEQPVYTEEDKQRISKWNEAVNRIRVRFGMTPFE